MDKHALYRKLFRWAEKKCRQSYAETRYSDVLCGSCKFWYSVVGGDVVRTHYGYTIKCGQCAMEHGWRTDIAPVPLSLDDYPLEQTK